MNQVGIADLIPGRVYRIEHKQGAVPRRIGEFIQLIKFSRGNGVPSAVFTNLFDENHHRIPAPTTTALRDDEWNFFDSGKTITAGQASRGLANHIPENVVRTIQNLSIGGIPGKGNIRFPSRGGKHSKTKKRKSHRKTRRHRR